MGTLVATFAFPSDAQGFAATVGGNTAASWQSADGSPSNGCLQFRCTARNKTNANNLYQRTLTFADMGVPAGSTVTAVTAGSAYYRCREWNVGSASGNQSDFVTLTPAGFSAITIAGGSGLYSNVSSWTQVAGTNATGLSIPSSTSCTIAWQADLSTGNSNSAVVTLAVDTITFTVTYSENASASIAGVAGAAASGLFASAGPGALLPLSLNLGTSLIATGVGASIPAVAGAGAAGIVTYGDDATVSIAAEPSGVSAGAGPGSITVTGSAGVLVAGVSAAGAVGSATSIDGVRGSILIFSLNLDSAGQSNIAYKYTADVFTPVFTEDPVDTVDVETYEDFVPRLDGFGAVNLATGSIGQVSGVAAQSFAGSVSVNFGTAGFPVGAYAVTVASNFVRPATTAVLPISGVAGSATVGTLSVINSISDTFGIPAVAAAGAVGSVTIPQAVGFLAGVAATGSARGVSVAAGGSVTTAVASVSAVGSAGSAVAANDAALVSGVAAAGGLGLISVREAASTDAVPQSVAGAGTVGSLVATSGFAATVTGVAGTGQAGTAGQLTSTTIVIGAISASGSAGLIGISGNSFANVAGVQGRGAVGASILNPGAEGSVTRRAKPRVKRVRVRVAR